MTAGPTTCERDKLKELVLYVAEKSGDDAAFGATKLNKLLFFSDFLAYAELGSSITGATYQKLDNGPAPRELLPCLRELQEEGAAHIEMRQRFAYTQKRTVPLRKPNLGLFTAEEISLVDEVIDALGKQNASDVSTISHALSVGWQVVGMREDIPYASVFISPRKPSDRDIERGRELAAAHGWA